MVTLVRLEAVFIHSYFALKHLLFLFSEIIREKKEGCSFDAPYILHFEWKLLGGGFLLTSWSLPHWPITAHNKHCTWLRTAPYQSCHTGGLVGSSFCLNPPSPCSLTHLLPLSSIASFFIGSSQYLNMCSCLAHLPKTSRACSVSSTLS